MTEKNYKNNQKTIKMAVTTDLTSIILNVKRLNAPLKRHRGLTESKTRLIYMVPTRGSLQA